MLLDRTGSPDDRRLGEVPRHSPGPGEGVVESVGEGVTAFGPGDREREMLRRYEESAFFWRMMKVVGHEATELMELDGGYGHGGVVGPAQRLVVEFAQRVTRPVESGGASGPALSGWVSHRAREPVGGLGLFWCWRPEPTAPVGRLGASGSETAEEAV
jgi:hypothetical protein